MNRIPDIWPPTPPSGDAAPVVLAHEAPFTIGPLKVEPGMRRIVRGDDLEAIVEPLVMQVLVALARADGAILTRDELVDRCWGGRIVGDDSIARVIARLRKLGAEFGQGAFAVETITKVGYRLAVAESSASLAMPGQRVDLKPDAQWRRPSFFAAGALALGTMAWAGLSMSSPATADSLTIGVEPVVSNVGDREGQRFASEVTGDLARVAGAMSRVSLIDAGAAADLADADFLVRVAVDRNGETLTANARLVARDGGAVLWSRSFAGGPGGVTQLREQVAIGIAETIRCGLEQAPNMRRDTDSMRIYMAGCDALTAEDWLKAESHFRKLSERRPEVGGVWACLAMATLLSSETQAAGDPGQLQAIDKRAEGYARKALALDPNLGRAYLALDAATEGYAPNGLAILEQGLRVDPENPVLQKGYATKLFNLGYVRASIAPALRSLALDPASRWAHESAVRRMLAAGQTARAFAIQDKAEQLWPDDPELRRQRVRLLPHEPDPAAALARFEAMGLARDQAPPLLRTELRWRANPKSLDYAELDREAERMGRDQPLSAWFIAAAMNRMQEHERAFAWLARAPRRNAQNQWSILFWPEAAPLRRDPRFFKAMAELGLVDIWRKRGQWPDFCSEPGLRYSCAAEAARLRTVRVARKS